MASNQNFLPNMPIIDAFWNMYSTNLNTGRMDEITMPIGLKFVIGQVGIDIIQNRFRDMIQALVTLTENEDTGLITIAPTRNPRGRDCTIPGVQTTKPRTSNKAKVARPPNAFILYRQHHHPIVKAEYPELHNNQISIILGNQWKQESNTNKAQFAALASRLKAKHLQENPGYHYQPRKPSEKKRRMTRVAKTTTATTSTLSSASIASGNKDVKSTATVPIVPTTPGSAISPSGASSLFAASAPGIASPPTISNESSQASSRLIQTGSGNAVFNLGVEDLDEDLLKDMLTEFNNSVPAPQNRQEASELFIATPVLHNESIEEAQNDANYYGSMINLEFDPLISSSADMNNFFDFQAASLPTPHQ